MTELDIAVVEVTRCPLCDAQELSLAFEEPPYRVLRCRSCGLGFVSPRRSERDLADLYIDDSYWCSDSPKTLGYHDYRGDEPLYLDTFRKRLDYALGDGPWAGAALDVGCAAGFCMRVLRERGFAAYGVEVSPTIASHAIERFGFDTVHVGTLQTAPWDAHSFEVITIWDVVEHVVDPHGLLVKARELLKPGGLLVVETQNIDSAFARLLGRRWHHYKHAEHIYHFSPPTVRRLLGEAGFEVQRVTHRHGGKYVSLHFIAERAGRIHPRLSRALAPMSRFDKARLYLNFMDEMVVLARPAATA